MTAGPPIVRSSFPATDNTESRTDSASIRPRFIRQSRRLSASIFAASSRCLRLLLICRAAKDQTMETLERAMRIVAKPDGEPIQQFRMRGLGAHAAEVARSIDQTDAEVILPYAIHDGSPRKHIVGIGDPVGQAARRAPSSAESDTLKSALRPATHESPPACAGLPGD